MKPSRPGAAAWLLLLAAALALRVGAGMWWQTRVPPGQSFVFGDSHSYWHLAGTIARGEPYQYGSPDARVFRTPGYPLALAPLFWGREAAPPVLAARVLNAVLGTAAVALCGVLAGLLFRDPWVSFGAAAWTAVDPGAVSMSVFVLSEAPFVPCLLAQLACTVRAWGGGARSRAWSIAAGAAAGAATLMRPSWLLFTPALIAGSLLAGGRRARFHAAAGAWMLLGLAAVMSPWWLRNCQATGRFIPTTLQVGASLYDGLSPQATGASQMDFVDPAYRELKAEDALRGDPGDDFEFRLDQRLRQRSLRWTAAHPGAALRLAAVKLTRMWNLWPNAEELRSWPLRLCVAAGFLPLLALSLAGVTKLWRLGRGLEAALLLAPAIYLTGLHVIFVSSIRYRQPAMVALIPAAAWALANWRPKRSPSRAAREDAP